MSPGILVRVTHRELSYSRSRGGNVVCAVDCGEIVLLIEDPGGGPTVEIFHPIHGRGFFQRSWIEVISD